MPGVGFWTAGPCRPRSSGWAGFCVVGKHVHMALRALNEVFPVCPRLHPDLRTVGRVLWTGAGSPSACPAPAGSAADHLYSLMEEETAKSRGMK